MIQEDKRRAYSYNPSNAMSSGRCLQDELLSTRPRFPRPGSIAATLTTKPAAIDMTDRKAPHLCPQALEARGVCKEEGPLTVLEIVLPFPQVSGKERTLTHDVKTALTTSVHRAHHPQLAIKPSRVHNTHRKAFPRNIAFCNPLLLHRHTKWGGRELNHTKRARG